MLQLQTRRALPLGTFAAFVALALMAARPLRADFPSWAYPVAADGYKDPADDGKPRHVPGSAIALTQRRIDVYPGGFPDWFPDEHPGMPHVVSGGRPPAVWACAFCHLPNGAGRPENSSLAGLSAGYITQQVANFRNGARPGSEPRRGPQKVMISIALAASDEEVAAAAAYFASLKPECHTTVIESATAPEVYVAGAVYAKVAGGGMEPIGGRIVEVPEELARHEAHDPHAPYIAYVPPGRLKKGADLVLTGGMGKTLQCATCHGLGLKGMGDIPRITGRSPSYVMRQLYDIRQGNRKGALAALMTVVVARLSDDDLTAISAYLASCPP